MMWRRHDNALPAPAIQILQLHKAKFLMQQYQCPNVGSCQLADDQTLIELSTGSDAKCSECNTTLKEVGAAAKGERSSLPKGLLAIAGAVVLLGGGAAFFLLSNKPQANMPTQVPTTQAAKPKTASAPEVLQPKSDKTAAGAVYANSDIAAKQDCAGKAQEQGNSKDAQACLDAVKGQVAVNEAVMQLQGGNLEQAQAKLDEALRLNPKDMLAHYNLAVLSARRNDPEMVVKHLQASIDNGFQQIFLIEKDPDLANVINHPAVREVINRALGGNRGKKV